LHLHIYEKIWLVFGMASLIIFLLIIGFAAFEKDKDGTAIKTIRVPKGSTALYQITTKDVVHGFQVAGTNVNMMVEPGHISRYEAVMKNAGEFTIVCNEYCGIGHYQMFGTVEVYE
jgi:cytochrome c oxidase subunit 2